MCHGSGSGLAKKFRPYLSQICDYATKIPLSLTYIISVSKSALSYSSKRWGGGGR